MNLRIAILLASLAANVLLAAFIVQQRPAPPETTPSAITSAAPNVSAGQAHSPDNKNFGDGAVSPQAQSEFRWAQLESEDYKEYVARLRSFSVPEKVIRDIIMADVQKLYRLRFAALRPPKKPANPNFWETRNQNYYPDRDQTKEQREQMRALQKEQAELIKTLLGEDVYEQIAKDSGYPDWMERRYGPLSKEGREKVTEMQQRFDEAQSEIYAKADGYIDQDTQAEVAALRRKLHNELGTVLTPEQLQDYELRSSEVAQQMKWELSSFEPDEKEFRALFAYKQALKDLDTPRSADDNGTPLTPEQRKAQQQTRKEMEESLKAALGEDRLKEFKLSDQYEYRNLLEAGVPKESVFKVADMKGEVELAAQKIRQNKELSAEQRNAALQAMKTETEQTLADMIGERRAKYYSRQGSWLRNLAPRPPQP